GEVAQRRRHQPHEAVEDDLQHRQTLVGDERGVDDRPDAGAFGVIVVAEVEAQQAVDLVLGQYPLGGRGPIPGGRLQRLGEGVARGEGRVAHAYCTSISSISTSSTWPGAAIRLTRRSISARNW